MIPPLVKDHPDKSAQAGVAYALELNPYIDEPDFEPPSTTQYPNDSNSRIWRLVSVHYKSLISYSQLVSTNKDPLHNWHEISLQCHD